MLKEMATEDAEVQGVEQMMAKKHAERMERLALINKTRIEGSNLRKSQAADSSDPKESVDAFLSEFAQRREVVEKGLASARNKEIEPNSIKSHLDSLALQTSVMEKLVADASYFLPAYDVRSSQTTYLKLKDELETASAELLPKKKFSFRNKAARTLTPTASCAAEPTVRETRATTQSGEEKPNVGAPASISRDGPAPAPLAVVEMNNRERIQGKDSTVFVRNVDVVGAELTLSHLVNCKVYLRGRLTTLYIHTLKNCQIFGGPVTGSVFIENVENSTLVLASHQIRIHSTKATDFYLRVRSRPIVEYTTKNRFAPYAFSYPGVQEDLAAANLAEENGMWEKIDDFRWLRAVHSPNWSSIPLKERIPVEDGSSVAGVGCDE